MPRLFSHGASGRGARLGGRITRTVAGSPVVTTASCVCRRKPGCVKVKATVPGDRSARVSGVAPSSRSPRRTVAPLGSLSKRSSPVGGSGAARARIGAAAGVGATVVAGWPEGGSGDLPDLPRPFWMAAASSNPTTVRARKIQSARHRRLPCSARPSRSRRRSAAMSCAEWYRRAGRGSQARSRTWFSPRSRGPCSGPRASRSLAKVGKSSRSRPMLAS